MLTDCCFTGRIDSFDRIPVQHPLGCAFVERNCEAEKDEKEKEEDKDGVIWSALLHVSGTWGPQGKMDI